MKRNEFLKTCGAGVCGCGMLGLLAPLSASAKGKEGKARPSADNNKQTARCRPRARFAKLVSIMGEDLGGAARQDPGRLGHECAQDYKALFQKYRGDLPGFLAKIKTAWVEQADYDETGILRVIGKPGSLRLSPGESGANPSRFLQLHSRLAASGLLCRGGQAGHRRDRGNGPAAAKGAASASLSRGDANIGKF